MRDSHGNPWWLELDRRSNVAVWTSLEHEILAGILGMELWKGSEGWITEIGA